MHNKMANVTLNVKIDADITTLLNLGEENATDSPGSELDLSSYIAIEKYLWLIFCPVLLVIGIIGNILNVIILYKLIFHRNATYTLLFILAFADMTVLLVGVTRFFILYLVEVDLRDLNEFSCKFNLFLTYFSMQFSSWILVLVTVVRFITTFLPSRQSKCKDITVKNILIAVLVIGVLLIGINLHVFWTNGLIIEKEKGRLQCAALDEHYFFFEHVFLYVDLILTLLLPSLIMIVLNSIICWELKKWTNMRMSLMSGSLNQNKQKSTKRVTRMLVVATSYFIVSSIPYSIYSIVVTYVGQTADKLTLSRLNLTWTCTYLLLFSQFASNFYLYTATNRKFRKELSNLTCRKETNRISTSVSTNSQTESDSKRTAMTSF